MVLSAIHWEANPSTLRELMGKYDKIEEELTNHPEKYPKLVSPVYSYVGEPTRGFQLVEYNDPEQLTRFALLVTPYIDFDCKPVMVEQAKLFREYPT